MTMHAEPLVCAVAAAGGLWLAWEWLGRRWRRSGWTFSAVGCLAAGAALWLPLEGLPLWKWAFSFWPNASFPLVVLVLIGLGQRLVGNTWFSRGDWDAAWWFGAVAGTLLYLHPLVPGSWDLYYFGWQHAVSVWAIAAFALAALAFGLRFGVVLLGTLVAYELRLLESPNGWDYLVDPVYWVVASAICLRRAWAAWRSRSGQVSPVGAGVPGS